jgi:hypothetical protein
MSEGGLRHVPARDAGRDVTDAVAVARRVAAAYAVLPGVVAVALGGSRGGGTDDARVDARSDVDLYVFAETPPSLADRAAVAAGGTDVEIDNRFWETEDGWTDVATGLALDVIFRSPSWTEGKLDRVLVRHEAGTRYSTCLWHNVRHAQPLADPSGWFGRLQASAARPYPEPLRRAIIAKNHPILRDARNAYRTQIAVALARGDGVSVNHRVAALLASYFDVVFALNHQTHPGEKRLVDLAENLCPLRPLQMRDAVAAVLAATASTSKSGDLLRRLDALVDGLDATLRTDAQPEGSRLMP